MTKINYKLTPKSIEKISRIKALRNQDPQKWTWDKIAAEIGMHVTMVHAYIRRDKEMRGRKS